MKTIALLSALFLYSSVQSQISVSMYHNTNPAGTTSYDELYALPYDPSRLIEVGASYDTTGNWQNNEYFVYEMNEVTGAVNQPFVIPLCTNLRKPAFLENGILVGGELLNGDVELIYWDGTNVTTFELNTYYGSYPNVVKLDGEVYVIANDSLNYELYHFDESTLTIQQVSYFHPGQDVVSVLKDFNNQIFYSVQMQQGPNLISSLHSNSLNGGFLGQQELINEISTPEDFDVSWSSAAVLDGELYFIHREALSTGNPTYGFESVMRLDSTGSYSVHSSQLIGNSTFGELFTWDDKLYYFQSITNELWATDDTSPMTIESTLPQGVFTNHYISENDRLYFTEIDDLTGVDNIIEYESGNYTERITGNHMHIINEFNNQLYVYDYGWGNGSKMKVFDTQWNILDSALIGVSNHPPVINTSLMYEGKFTFLDGWMPRNVLQLEGDVLANSTLVFDAEQVYPNPVSSDQNLIVVSNATQMCTLLTSEGKLIYSATLDVGGNALNLENLPEGIYFLTTENKTYRIVIRN